MISTERTTQTQKRTRSWIRNFLMAAVALAVTVNSAQAVVYTWNTGSSVWDTTTANWAGGGATWVNGNEAVFGGTAGSTITMNEVGITANSVQFSANNDVLAASFGFPLNNVSGSALSIGVDAGITTTISSFNADPAENVVQIAGTTSEATLGLAINVGTGGTLNLNASSVPLNTAVNKYLVTIDGGGDVVIGNGATLSNYYNGGNAQTNKLNIGDTSANNTVTVNGKLLSNSIRIGQSTFGGNELIINGGGNLADPTVRGTGNNLTWRVGGDSSNNSITVNTLAFLLSDRASGTNNFYIWNRARKREPL